MDFSFLVVLASIIFVLVLFTVLAQMPLMFWVLLVPTVLIASKIKNGKFIA